MNVKCLDTLRSPASNNQKILIFISSVSAKFIFSPYSRRRLTTLFICHVTLEVFTAVTMKNAAFWDVTPCGFCKNPSFRRTVFPSSV
jgi:hypothetical protein